jgi:hypothetical protein
VNLPPLDEAGYQDRVLMAEIGKLNEKLGRYLLRYLDAEANRAEPVSQSEERALAEAMVALASKVFERAGRHTTSATAPALEGGPTLRRLPTGRPSER